MVDEASFVAKLFAIDKRAAAPHHGRMDGPRHALAAPSHPQPYGWYAQLRRTRPLFFDAQLQLWVASDPALVREALQHPWLHVRPPGQPVQCPLIGTAAGEVFAQLVRMTDGAFHARHKPEVLAAATRWSRTQVREAAQASVDDLAARTQPDALLSALPVQAMARLLGVRPDKLDATVEDVQAFVQGIAPAASHEAIGRADAAALALMAQGEAEGLSRVQSANRIALMQQAMDATAGLLGNCIVALQQAPDQPVEDAWIAKVARRDPAVHNTRRFAAQDLVIAGERIAAGQGVLLVLVDQESSLGFGHGAHACPGEHLALGIAVDALRSLQSTGALRRFGPAGGYRPLPNARIPVFCSKLS